MRILVCGGRNYNDRTALFTALDQIAEEYGAKMEPDKYGNWLPTFTVIHGAARGADSLAHDYAVSSWCPQERFPADWQKHGRAAGPIRNQQMIDIGRPDLVVAFPGGRGTADMVRRAREAGVPVREIG